jgi:hypothetical protein
LRGSLLGFLDPPEAPGGPHCSILEAINHLVPLKERGGVLPATRLERIRKTEEHCGLSACRDAQFGLASRTFTTRNATASTNDALRLRLPDGSVRSFSIPEIAALQSFPTSYSFAECLSCAHLPLWRTPFLLWWGRICLPRWIICASELLWCERPWRPGSRSFRARPPPLRSRPRRKTSARPTPR